MTITFFPPDEILAPYVDRFWLLEGAPADESFERILPDGCAEMIVHRGATFTCRCGGRETTQPTQFVFGQISKYIEIRPLGRVATVGVKFKPHGLAAFCEIAQSELVDDYHVVTKVFKTTVGQEYISDAMSVGECISIIQRLLKENLVHRDIGFVQVMETVGRAVDLLKDSRGYLRIEDLARRLNLSKRDLERKFQRYVGLSPKALATLYRFQHVMSLRGQFSSLTALAHEANYYDQAHFIRDFQKLTGTNPKTLLAEDASLTNAFLNP